MKSTGCGDIVIGAHPRCYHNIYLEKIEDTSENLMKTYFTAVISARYAPECKL
jgi:hypothetical protein